MDLGAQMDLDWGLKGLNEREIEQNKLLFGGWTVVGLETKHYPLQRGGCGRLWER